MTPKEKAEELIDKFSLGYYHLPNAKQCALLCVEEIIIAVSMCYSEDMVIDYWKEVRECLFLKKTIKYDNRNTN